MPGKVVSSATRQRDRNAVTESAKGLNDGLDSKKINTIVNQIKDDICDLLGDHEVASQGKDIVAIKNLKTALEADIPESKMTKHFVRKHRQNIEYTAKVLELVEEIKAASKKKEHPT
jgi:uncharacterized protein YajQ (UPF0234 family)